MVNNTMYMVAPWPNKLFALDLTKSGALKWSYDPNPSPAAKGEACCDWVNRGAVYADGKIIYNTLDGLHDCARRQQRQTAVAHAPG